MSTTPRPSNAPRAPAAEHPSHLAAQLIYAEGSKTEAQLWSAGCGFSERPEYRTQMLERAFEMDWLRRLEDGRIALTDFALEYLETAPAPKHKGQLAAPRDTNLLARPAWRSNLNPRGTRSDIPDWSHQPAGKRNFTKA